MDPILDLIPGRERDLGGFQVRRVLPIGHRKTVGPFIFFDHLGPAVLKAGAGMDVRPHPHIGLATVTYLFEGRMRHRDSLGYVRDIEPLAVNWMTAGSGIVHSERSTPEDRLRDQPIHGLQSWVALPAADEECAPDFVHHPAAVTLMLLGGAPFPEERHVFWNFVSSRPERIEQAKADWRAQRFAKVPGETEFIPLPAP